MNTKDFDFDLPPDQIAQYPSKVRDQSRLLIAGETLEDQHFNDLIDHLRPNDLLVFNNTKTLAARLYGHKKSGGKLELLFERLKADHSARVFIKSNRAPAIGTQIILLNGDLEVTITGRENHFYTIQFPPHIDVYALLETHGELPLPPYIKRKAEAVDVERYQTIFAQHYGAVATPTAGLHFSHKLMKKIAHKGIQTAELTLHVGAGTFQPVQVEAIKDHKMHSEYFHIDQKTIDQIIQTRALNGRVIAVGTTVMRSLESAWIQCQGQLNAIEGETDIFITPGFQFGLTNALITNFHLPHSTLLMLVSAFYGFNNTLTAYRYAVENQYRFFSYGDAMFIPKSSAH